MKKTFSYLALGDSYTIGEAVEQQESFPHQLAAILNERGLAVSSPKIIAKTGWTTGELKHAIQQEQLSETFDLVTLLIGVNNQYRGYSPDAYRKEFADLLRMAIGFARGDKQHVVVISIPDWGVTEFAQQSGRNLETISREVALFNEIKRQETQLQQVAYVDITPISQEAIYKPLLIACDGLHPSERMYAQWAKLIAEKIVTSGMLGIQA
jgi:lysophospholipase L1-like esterase